MIQVPKSAYVPPHVRKRLAANPQEITKTDASTDIKTDATADLLAVSDDSKTEHHVESHSSPNGVALVDLSPPSPPTTVPEESKTIETDAWAGWNEPIPDPPSAPPRRENPNWPRGPKAAPRKNVWPKQRDMKPLPSESESDGGVDFRSNSNGDPDYDVKKLQDWNGDWLPPPEQWSARRGFINRHFGQVIEEWMNTHSEECIQTMNIESGAFSGEDAGDKGMTIPKDLVPRYWMPSTIDGEPLRKFWEKLRHCAPAALGDDDLTDTLPFWDMYENEGSCFIDGLVVPDARVDATDPDNHTRGQFTGESITVYMEKVADRNHAKHLNLLKKQNRPVREPKVPIPQPEDRRLKPTGNIYLRPVQPADVHGITDIYNHYVENSIHATEFDARTEQHIRDRVDTIVQAGLPFLVAIAKGNKPKGPRGYVSEKIIGYINLDDYCDRSSLYRFCFELEMYVHPGYTCQGVARCLLDRLLEMVNTGYNARGGYEYINDYDYLKTGPSRVVKTILINILHARKELPPWAKVLEMFKFVRCGHISQAGFKHDQVVDLSIFQHHTTEHIDPKGVPAG
ncbi:hypothetical protein P153DRAFT_349850 [Dothidotthia symphoricarpi CBS 119687]|uniref:N-acetyltransferase domain-containing protein n=1 Tax=Dothidotthia symphoricarpi CBS 119687 TaxID=1392245 RepID=A0A6A6A1V3_9PLEO|nr:uncharacterized protein P153DRAFT_349850 [Dothidotthia symphoricarpi CBS 119687]KAF2124698.1 hypothetical protein P153DRAFT_349850 [Dothidotthia symphoricarpi CBS 119687]